LFQFFLKATQLEQTKQDYVAAEESKRVAVEVMKQKEKVGYVLRYHAYMCGKSWFCSTCVALCASVCVTRPTKTICYLA